MVTQNRPRLLSAPIEQRIFFDKWLAVEIGDRSAVVLTTIARQSILRGETPEGLIFNGSSAYLLLMSSGMKAKTINRRLKDLEGLGFVERHNIGRLDAEELLRQKTPSNSSWPFSKQCEWCGTKTAVLHSHHHPIPNSQGGTQTVDICPNCHTEFHRIVDQLCYRVSKSGSELLAKYYQAGEVA